MGWAGPWRGCLGVGCLPLHAAAWRRVRGLVVRGEWVWMRGGGGVGGMGCCQEQMQRMQRMPPLRASLMLRTEEHLIRPKSISFTEEHPIRPSLMLRTEEHLIQQRASLT